MVKEIIDFKKVAYRRKFITPESNKRMGYKVGQTSRAYRTDGEDEDEEAEKKELLKKIKGIVSKELESRAKKEDIESVTEKLSFLEETVNEKGEKVKSAFPIETLREMADENTGVMKKLTELGLKIQQMEADAERSVKAMSVRSVVEKWHKENKEAIEQIKEGKRANLSQMEIRDAVTMHFSTVNSGTSPYIGTTTVEPGVNGILRFPNTFWDFLQKGRTSSKTYVWVNMVSTEGDAAFIGPGVAKPGVSFSMQAETSVSKKIAASAKAGTEILDDIEGMTSFIEQELKEALMEKINETLMDSAGSTTVPTGIKQLSTTYTLTTVKTTNPTYVDAIRAVVAQLRSGKLKGEITVFINSIDAANMDIAKASDSGVYLLPPFVTQDGRTIGGARIVEDSNIPVGYFQAGFLRFYRILIHQDYFVAWGWENDDFTKNLVTAVGEMRLHQFFNTRHTGAFVYDSFENVVESITQA